MTQLNIVIPMAGRGSRFSNIGYKEPKPLIKVGGKYPMIELVVSNLMPRVNHRFIFLCLKEHRMHYQLDLFLSSISHNCEVVEVDRVTEGAACTVLLAEKHINNDDPLMIANSDQWVDCDIDDYLELMKTRKADGFIMTMTTSHPKWSFLRFGSDGAIVEVVEKKPVSSEGTVGIYNFSKGRYFVEGAHKMIERNLRVNNEFYVAPVYNQLIEKKYVVDYLNIGGVSSGMYGLGTPEDLDEFEKSAACQNAFEKIGILKK